MKKFLLVMVACCLTFVGCKWYHETFDSVEDCAKWYTEKMYDAAMENDVDEFIEYYQASDEWHDSLSESDREAADKANEAWLEANGDEDKLFEFFMKNYERLEKVRE